MRPGSEFCTHFIPNPSNGGNLKDFLVILQWLKYVQYVGDTSIIITT